MLPTTATLFNDGVKEMNCTNTITSSSLHFTLDEKLLDLQSDELGNVNDETDLTIVSSPSTKIDIIGILNLQPNQI